MKWHVKRRCTMYMVVGWFFEKAYSCMHRKIVWNLGGVYSNIDMLLL